MTKSKPIEAWHFLRADRCLNYKHGNRREGRVEVKAGTTLRAKASDLKLCYYGLHASVRAIDALKYAPGCVISRVLCSGTVITSDDKLVCSQRKVLWLADATNTLHEFACRIAEQALAKVGSPDPRSLKAIEVKRAWVKGEATDADLSAARDAARDAARGADLSAARAAARDAARGAAWDAALAAAGDAANTQLESMLRSIPNL